MLSLRPVLIFSLLMVLNSLPAQNIPLADSLLTIVEKDTRHFKWQLVLSNCERIEPLLEGSKAYELFIKLHKSWGDAYAETGSTAGFTAHIDTAISIIDQQFNGIHPLKCEILNTRIEVTAFFDLLSAELFLQQFKNYLDAHPDEKAYANYLRRLGTVKAMQGQFYSGIEFYEKSFEKGGFYSTGSEANDYQNIAFFYDQTEQYQKAFSYKIKSVEILENEAIVNHLQLSKIYQALSLEGRGQLSKAAIQRKIFLAEKAKKHGYLAGDGYWVLSALLEIMRSNLLLYKSFGEDPAYIDNALQMYDSIQIVQQEYEATFLAPLVTNHSLISNAIFADLYLQKEDINKASTYIQRFLALKATAPKRNSGDKDYWYKARLSLMKGQPFVALKYIQAVICTFSSETNCKYDFNKNPSLEICQQSDFNDNYLLLKTQAFLKAYQQHKTIKYLDAAKESFLLWDALVKNRNGFENILALWQRPYVETGYEIFNTYFHFQHESSNLYEALLFAEKQKNYSFVKKIDATEQYLKRNIPDSVRLKKGILKEEMDFLKSKVDTEVASNALAVEASIQAYNKKKKEYFDYLSKMQQQFPTDTTFNTAMTIFDSKKLEILTTKIKTESVLEYVITKDKMYAIILDQKGNNIVELKGTASDLRKLIEAYRNKLIENKKGYETDALAIYNRIFSPVLPYISSKDLLIIPDMELLYLPFDLLMDKRGHFVIEDYSIRYVYSLIWEQYEKEKIRRPHNGQILAMAATPEMKAFAALYPDVTRDDLGHLPGAITEVQQLSKLLKGNCVSKQQATESFFKNMAENYGVLHLATHAIINENAPRQSQLVFVQEDVETQDAYLNAYEISNLRLNADLVTLSACNSGYGRIKNGEGVQSLALAFAYAGCPNSVSSLWTIHDKSSATIMKYFYENLLTGMPKHKALRAAKLAFFKTQPIAKKHPYYWGGFVYYGNNQPIVLDKKEVWGKEQWSVLVLGLGFVLVFVLRNKRRA